MKKKLTFHIWGIVRYVMLLACIVGLWWFFRTYELFLMLLLTIFLAVASIYVLWWKQDGFSVTVSLPASGIGKEKEVPLTIRVKNACRFAGFAADVTYQVKNIFTEYAESKRERIWTAPGTREAVSQKLLSRHLGRVEVIVTEFVVWDWLGICSLRDLAEKKSWVIVGPVAVETVGEDLSACVENFPNENETKKRGTEINPDYEIREYVPGDDLKSIHWKLTAKTGRTMVRERLATGREKINVLLALTKDEQENDELMASLHSLALMLLDKGYPIRLCWLGHGGTLQGRYLAEEGELANAVDEILSASGKQDPGQARNVMEAEYPGEAYVIVQNGAYKGEYVRK